MFIFVYMKLTNKELCNALQCSARTLQNKLRNVAELEKYRTKVGRQYMYDKSIIPLLVSNGVTSAPESITQKGCTELKQRIFELEQTLKIYENEVSSLNRILQEKDERIQDLKDSFSRLDFLIGGINQTLDNQTDSIKLLKDK